MDLLRSSLARRLMTIGILLVLGLAVVTFVVYRRVQMGIADSVHHKSSKSTTATVVSVVEMPDRNPSKTLGNNFYKVCFIIDNFDQVEPDMRQGYQSAEASRLAHDGPRCATTSRIALAKTINSGDKLTVTYLLENQYAIDVVSATKSGQDIFE